MPDLDESGERREVLAWLDSIKMTPEMFAGITAAEFPLEMNRRILQPGKRFSREEVRNLVELEGEDVDRVLQASGYSADYEFTADDIGALHSFATAMGVFSDEELLHFIRVVSSAMGRIADAATALFRIDVSPGLEQSGAAEIEWARSNYASIQLLEPLMLAVRTFLLRELGVSSARNDAARGLIDDTANTSTLRLAVGFVDLVGYTSMAETMNPDDLGRFVREFEARAHDAVTAHGGRVVKLIGDEVMFVNLSPADACHTALALIAAFDDDAATPSGGIATGDVVGRGGDYYGSIVNLAARIAGLAVTGEVLVDAETAGEAGGDAAAETTLEFEPAGRRMLKGFADPVSLLSITPSPPT